MEQWPTMTRCESVDRFEVEFSLNGDRDHLFPDEKYEHVIGAELSRFHNYVVPQSHHYICPKCGWYWARRVVKHAGTYHVCVSQLCPAHGMGHLGDRKETIPDLPLSLLCRELLIVINDSDYFF